MRGRSKFDVMRTSRVSAMIDAVVGDAKGRYVISTFAHRASGFLGAVVVIRGLTSTEVGQLTAIWIFSAVLATFLSAGLDWKLTLDGADSKSPESLRTVSRARISVGALVSILGGAYLLTSWGGLMAIVAIGLALTSTFDAARSGAFARLLGLGENQKVVTVLWVGVIGRMSAAAVCLAFDGINRAVALSICLVASSSLELLGAWAAATRTGPVDETGISLYSLFLSSRALLALAIVTQIYSRVDAFAVGALLTLDELGAYGLWLRSMEPVLLTLGAIQPILLRSQRLGIPHRPESLVWSCLALTAPMAVIGPDLLSWVFKFDSDRLAFTRMLPLYATAAAVATIYIVKVMERGLHAQLSVLIARVLAINIALDLVMIPRFGTWGAAVCAFLAEVILIVMLRRFLRSETAK